MQALAALHLLWLWAILPFVVWAVRCWTPTKLYGLGLALLAVGILAVGTIVGREVHTWWSAPPPSYRRYPVRRLVVVLAMQTDIPAVQVVAAGLTCWLIGKRRRAKVVGKSCRTKPV